MEVINITEEQKINLSKKLAKLVFKLKKDDDVECIYFAPYKGLGPIRGNVLEVTLVKKVPMIKMKLIKLKNKINAI